VGELVTATVEDGDALGASDVVGGTVPELGVAEHVDAQSITASARRFFTTSG